MFVIVCCWPDVSGWSMKYAKVTIFGDKGVGGLGKMSNFESRRVVE
jgi:hypothetical protein